MGIYCYRTLPAVNDMDLLGIIVKIAYIREQEERKSREETKAYQCVSEVTSSGYGPVGQEGKPTSSPI